jgi:hypothetical protein
MRVTIGLKGYYHWVDVPPNTQVTEEDKEQKLVRPMANGKWQMRVNLMQDTHMQVHLNEEQVIARIWFVRHEPGLRLVLSRAQGITSFVDAHHMPLCAHSKWATKVEIEADEGPDENLFRTRLEGLAALFGYDFDEMLKAYTTPTTTEQHAAHMSKHFGIKEASK